MIRGIGIDTVELDRIARVHREYGDRFLRRIFTRGERAYIARWADPAPRMAGRFAVKEACMKALGTGWGSGVRWRDIDVGRSASGKPEIRLSGRAEEILRRLGASAVHCTITHGRRDAVAVVVLE